MVSKFYLKGFSNGRDQVRRMDTSGEQSIKVSINDATVRKDFYTLTLPDGEKSDILERVFSGIEADASRALRSVTSGAWPIAGEQRFNLAQWISLQHLRSEGQRENQQWTRSNVIRLAVGIAGKEALRRHIETATNSPISDQELDSEWLDLTKPGGPTLASDPASHGQLIGRLLPRMTNHLAGAHWTVFKFNRRTLNTSDHPVCLVGNPDRPEWEGLGILNAELFYTPLNRRMALVIQPQPRTPQSTMLNSSMLPDLKITGTARLARTLNQEIVNRAQRHLYFHPDDIIEPQVQLPKPAPDQQANFHANIDGFVQEDGFFPGGVPRTPSAPVSERGKGFGLADLPWPIPGRVKPTGGSE